MSKVPAVALGFWALKILATTLGEVGGDAVSMSSNLGYLVGTGIFLAIFVVVAAVQIAAKRFHPYLYWGTIVASTTTGTTLADFATRSLGIGYPGGSALLLGLLLVSLLAWRLALGTIDVASVSTPRAELFYWSTIMCSQTLGTALGDWTADTAGLGYVGAAIVFGGLLLAVLVAYLATSVSRTALFWAAFVLTRPLGAVIGDFLDKPLDAGGLALSRYATSGILLVLILVGVFFIPQRAAAKAH
jgi:uncharacterized membrane-anchored protein